MILRVITGATRAVISPVMLIEPLSRTERASSVSVDWAIDQICVDTTLKYDSLIFGNVNLGLSEISSSDQVLD
jgi:hypothetical protein